MLFSTETVVEEVLKLINIWRSYGHEGYLVTSRPVERRNSLKN